MIKKPELNIPAGNLEKLKIAINYGADAVYCGFKDFNLRNFAGNLSLDEISRGVELIHNLGKKIYLTLNIFGRNSHLTKLPDLIKELDQINIDGFIISDPGFIAVAQR